MKTIAKLMAAAAVAAVCTAAQAVPVQWTTGPGANGHWYDMILANAAGAAFTWDEAFADAAAGGGYLATITSADEQAFLVANLPAALAWIGGHDRVSEGSFVWQNGPEAGAAFTFTAWSGGEPNNCCGGENDVLMNWDAGGNWNDIGTPAFPDFRVAYVIEFAGRIPEPGALALVGLGLMGLVGLGARRRAVR